MRRAMDLGVVIVRTVTTGETMTKVVFNDSHGGFGLSPQARELYKVRAGHEFEDSCDRHDPILVSIVEELGEDANNWLSRLRIRTVDGNRYRIRNMGLDGLEVVEVPGDIKWVETL